MMMVKLTMMVRVKRKSLDKGEGTSKSLDEGKGRSCVDGADKKAG